jgi:hypothetical protein
MKSPDHRGSARDAPGWLAWAVGVPKNQKVYPADVSLVLPVVGRGRPRKNQIPDHLSIAAETTLTKAKWKKVSWGRGIKGPLSARFAALRIRIASSVKIPWPASVRPS